MNPIFSNEKNNLCFKQQLFPIKIKQELNFQGNTYDYNAFKKQYYLDMVQSWTNIIDAENFKKKIA